MGGFDGTDRRRNRVIDAIHRFPPTHPVWKLLNIVVSSLCITFVFTACAYATANSFDANELQMLGAGGLITSLGKGLIEKVWKGWGE